MDLVFHVLLPVTNAQILQHVTDASPQTIFHLQTLVLFACLHALPAPARIAAQVAPVDTFILGLAAKFAQIIASPAQTRQPAHRVSHRI